MRTAIKKQKKNNHALYLTRERNKFKRKKEMSFDNDSTTIYRHAPHHMKEDIMMHSKRQ